MFFDTWSSIGRTIVAGVLAYAALIVFLHISGKRSLAKMNAFDLVVTVALGSTLATVLVSRNVPLADGVTALALLIALQFVVAWTSVRLQWFEKAVKASLLVSHGELRRDEMRRQRVSEEEIRAAARSAGLASLRDAAALRSRATAASA